MQFLKKQYFKKYFLKYFYKPEFQDGTLRRFIEFCLQLM